MHDDTHHKSFEERVDEVLKEHIQIVGDGWWHPNYSIGELKAALLAAHKEDVERIKDEINIYLVKEGLRHGTEILKDIRTRANLTGKEQA